MKAQTHASFRLSERAHVCDKERARACEQHCQTQREATYPSEQPAMVEHRRVAQKCASFHPAYSSARADVIERNSKRRERMTRECEVCFFHSLYVGVSVSQLTHSFLYSPSLARSFCCSLLLVHALSPSLWDTHKHRHRHTSLLRDFQGNQQQWNRNNVVNQSNF
jgi:hypothetical protein